MRSRRGGMKKNGLVTSMNNSRENDFGDCSGKLPERDRKRDGLRERERGSRAPHSADDRATLERAAAENFAIIVQHVMRLYAPGCSSVSAAQARELSLSVAYALAHSTESEEGRMLRLATEQPFELHKECLAKLDRQMDEIIQRWRGAIAVMPDLRNVALRDTLASIGRAPKLYDKLFAAHEVPCDIQYQLSRPVSDELRGLDYLDAWIAQFRREAEWIARFDAESCSRVLRSVCPDYRGLHVNLYDLLSSRQGELKPKERRS